MKVGQRPITSPPRKKPQAGCTSVNCQHLHQLLANREKSTVAASSLRYITLARPVSAESLRPIRSSHYSVTLRKLCWKIKNTQSANKPAVIRWKNRFYQKTFLIALLQLHLQLFASVCSVKRPWTLKQKNTERRMQGCWKMVMFTGKLLFQRTGQIHNQTSCEKPTQNQLVNDPNWIINDNHLVNRWIYWRMRIFEVIWSDLGIKWIKMRLKWDWSRPIAAVKSFYKRIYQYALKNSRRYP